MKLFLIFLIASFVNSEFPDADQTINMSILDDLNLEARILIEDFEKNDKIFTNELRNRFVQFVVKFSPIEKLVEQSNNPSFEEKVYIIKYRFRRALKIRYSLLKENFELLVSNLLAPPVFVPFLTVFFEKEVDNSI
ncbi:unnamed protein product [Caenorhabditis angaria]|uniref:NR LBD domain-containing protein n=1 Tax=Caenorhabditis angaria TaxID=860376 RepID=A0A9P1I935_9PELO|nr:unnamed protein product [Caenorhabditis angaria]